MNCPNENTSETGKEAQEQKPKTCELAAWSAGLTLVSFLCIVSLFIIPNCMSIIFLFISIILAIIFGIFSIFKIKASKGQLKGILLAVVGVTIHIIVAVVIIYGFTKVPRIANRMICGSHLAGLGRAIQAYSNENECKGAVVKGGKVMSCHYAINPNAEPNSPADIVLLFETIEGWNQSGGPETLTTENHNGEGCNVLYNDGSVKFVKTKELEQLKWKKEIEK